MRPSVTRSISMIQNHSSQDTDPELPPTNESDKMQLSDKSSHQIHIPNVTNLKDQKKSENTINQSNQRLLSRIPVLIKR